MTQPYLVSEATLRTEDLLPAFLSALDDVLEASTFRPGADDPATVRRYGDVQSQVGDIERRMEQEGYWDSEDAQWDLETVQDLLNEYAPEGLYFGACEGDGACFGFWAVEEDATPGPLFSVVEYSSHFCVRHNPSGQERPMGDGVDVLSDADGNTLSPGTTGFVEQWAAALNDDEWETLQAYFPDLAVEQE